MTLKLALNDYIVGLRHVGFLVDDIDKSVASFVRLYGIPADSVRFVPESVDAETFARFAFLTVGENEFELVQPISDELRASLHSYPSGSAGINHVAWQVSDLDACLQVLQNQGIGPGHVTPDGPIAYGSLRFVYLDPASINGLLVELIEIVEISDSQD